MGLTMEELALRKVRCKKKVADAVGRISFGLSMPHDCSMLPEKKTEELHTALNKLLGKVDRQCSEQELYKAEMLAQELEKLSRLFVN
jgi:hypothetical protein